MASVNESGFQLRQVRLQLRWILACAAIVAALVAAAMLTGTAFSSTANTAARFGRTGGFGAGFGGQNGGFGARGQGQPGQPGQGQRQGPGPGASGFGQNGGLGAINQLDGVASALGISSDALQAELTAGSSIGQIISEHGKTPDDVVAAVVAQDKTQLDQRVASGQLSQAQEDTTLANFRASLTQAIADNTLNGNGGFSGTTRGQRPGVQNGRGGQLP